MVEKPHTVLLLIFMLQQEVLKFNDKFFKHRKSKFWESHFFHLFLIVTLLNNLFISFLNLFIFLIELKKIH